MAESKPRIVCIIPAYNEVKTVASVADLASGHPDISRVVVVDDGSIDGTSEAADSVEGVEIIRLETNRGKGAAMRAGLDATDEPYVLFLDADLIGFNAKHISDLIRPVVENGADMTVGLFRGGRIHTDLAHIITPSLSGQRAVKRSVLDGLDMDSVGFAIERALTELWQLGKIKVVDVILKGVTHRTKEEKRGYFEGVKQRAKMYKDILEFEGGKFRKKVMGKNRKD